MTDSFQQRVLRVLASELCVPAGTVELSDSLVVDWAVDSLGFVCIEQALGDAFGLEFPGEDVDACRTVGDVVALVDRAVAAKAAAVKLLGEAA